MISFSSFFSSCASEAPPNSLDIILAATFLTPPKADETIQEIVGIFETNSIEIRLQQSEVNGLYEIGSMMEHSCCPNVRMSFDDKFNVSSSTVPSPL